MDLNNDILWLIAKKLDNNDWWSFRHTCRQFYYSVTEKDINTRIIKLLTEKTKIVKRLARCMVCHFCNDCCCKDSVECSICYGSSHESCNGWDTKIEYCGAINCQNAICRDCFKFCFSCNMTVCNNHLISCPNCSRLTCSNCIKVCIECSTEYCIECSHKIKCGLCIKNIYVCDKIECSICGDDFCMPCTRVCKLCNNRVCSYDYDDFTKICLGCEGNCSWCLPCDSYLELHKLKECTNCSQKNCSNCTQLCNTCHKDICDGCYSNDKVCDLCFDKGV